MLLDLKNGGSPYDTAIVLPAGTAANPAVQVGGSNTGIYSTGTTNLSAAIGGTKILSIDSTGITVTGTITSSGGDALGDITVASITGSDSSLDIAGFAAAQGGSISLVGGVSSTTGNAGGGLNLTGAAGTGVGAGGAIVMAGGASGSGSTGNGGLISVTAGAAASTNGTGGAASLVGGLGRGTGAGGAITITSGAAGATGVAGAVAITVGAATAGNGSGMTITGGAGAGGTATGGNVNITGGAAVSTGAPGEVQVNADSNLAFATYYFTGTPAATNQAFFVAPRALRVKTIACVFSTAAGGASTLTVTKDSTTAAPGTGTSLHQSGSFNLASTANTVQNASVSTTIATVNMAAGDRLSVVFANAIQSTAGLVITVGMVPI